HDGETRLPEVLRQPGGGDQPLRVRVVGERGVGVSGKAHGVKSGTTTARVRGRTGAAHLVGTTRLATRDLVRRCRARGVHRTRSVPAYEIGRWARVRGPWRGKPGCEAPAGWRGLRAGRRPRRPGRRP